MSIKELNRVKLVQDVLDGMMKPGLAARQMGVTSRHFRRILERYRSEGAPGLVSKSRNRPSNHRLPQGLGGKAIAIIRQDYPDFGPTFAAEKLREQHGINLSKETVRQLMIDNGLWVPKKIRPPKIYQPRYRRECFGELIQIDGSDHRWFEDRASACTLLVYVDDATSRIQALYFAESESTFSYFQITRAYLEAHGKPVAFYSDKASVFRVNAKNAKAGDGHTQFGRALFELNIEGICANSSQAKGRVERAHRTLQDRLVKELRLRNISSISDANAYAAEFAADYNQRFARPPRSDHDAHRSIRPDEDLNLIFCWKEPRRVSQSLTVQYDKVMYLLKDCPESRRLIGRYIDIYHYPDGRVEPRACGVPLEFVTYDRLSEIKHGEVVDNKRLGHVLEVARLVQEKRDNTRSQSAPSPLNARSATRQKNVPKSRKKQRDLSAADVAEALMLSATGH